MTTDYISKADFRRIFQHLTYDNYLAVRLSLETGLRIGDVVALKSDCLKGTTLTFTAAKTGKSGKAEITKDLADKLRRYSASDFIFASSSKLGHRTRQAVWKDVKKAAAAEGFAVNVAPHSARKTFAVGVAQTQGIAAAQRALQHDSQAVTAGYVLSGLFADAKEHAHTSLRDDEVEALADLIAEKVVTAIKKEHLLR